VHGVDPNFLYDPLPRLAARGPPRHSHSWGLRLDRCNQRSGPHDVDDAREIVGEDVESKSLHDNPGVTRLQLGNAPLRADAGNDGTALLQRASRWPLVDGLVSRWCTTCGICLRRRSGRRGWRSVHLHPRPVLRVSYFGQRSPSPHTNNSRFWAICRAAANLCSSIFARVLRVALISFDS
jgi:hypothetical protein